MNHNLKDFRKANTVEFNSPSKLLSNTVLHDPFLNMVSLVFGNLLSKYRKPSVDFLQGHNFLYCGGTSTVFRIHRRNFPLTLCFPVTKLPLVGQYFTIQYFSVAQIFQALKAVVDCICGLQANHFKVPVYLPTMILITDCIQ